MTDVTLPKRCHYENKTPKREEKRKKRKKHITTLAEDYKQQSTPLCGGDCTKQAYLKPRSESQEQQ